MGEPARKFDPVYDDENDNKLSSAQDRANERWGLREPDSESTDDPSSPSDEGPTSARDKASKRWGLDPDELNSAEETGEDPAATAQDTEEASALATATSQFGQNDEIPFSEEPEKRGGFRKFVTRKKTAAGGAIGITLGIVFSILSILQGPAQLEHFSHLLQDFHFVHDTVFTESRVKNIFEYVSSIEDPTSRNLGFYGNIVANHYEKSLASIGLTPKYENRRLRFLEIDTTTPEGKKAHQTMKDNGVKVSLDEKGIATVDFQGTSASERRQAIGAMVDLLKINGVSSVVSKRLLKLRAAVSLHPFTNAVRAADESLLQFRDRLVQKWAKKRTAGASVNPPDASAAPAEADSNGNIPPGEADAEAGRSQAAKDAKSIITDLFPAVTFNGKKPALSARTKAVTSKISKGVGIAGLVALTCSIQQLGDKVYDIRDANINQPLERTGTDIIASGSQEEAMKDVNLEEVGAASANLYDTETNTSWASAASIQAELGEPITGPDLPLAAKPGNNRPELLNILDETIGKIPGGAKTCAGLTSTVGGFILDGAGWALDATGPIGFAINASTSTVVGIGSSILTDHVLQWLAGEQVAGDAAGALLGNEANYGAFLAANDAAIASGGAPLSSAQSAQLDAESTAARKESLKNQSLYARYFDINQPYSVASKALFETPNLQNPKAAFASIIGRPMSIFSSLLGSLTPKASAATSYDYGFPEFGFSAQLRDDPRYEDPYTNENMILPQLATLNDRYKLCYHTTIDPTTYKIISGKAARYDQINNPANHCSDPGQTFADGTNERDRYRFYLADMVSAKSLACYEGLDEETCGELGFGNAGAATAPVAADAGVPAVGNTASTPCAPGTTDDGEAQAYSAGQSYLVRLCGIPGFISSGEEDITNGGTVRVNSTVSGKWLQVFQNAASANLTLKASSSFRSMLKQQELYTCYVTKSCNGGREAAVPGQSNHQSGYAIDIEIVPGGNDPTLTQCKATPDAYPTYKWLAANAPAYAIQATVESECWHWSVGGS